MAFSTACSKSALDRLARLALWLLWWPLLVWSADIEVTKPQISPGEDGYVLSADFVFELNPRLEEAVSKGVALYFVVDFELTRGRWYWFDEKVLTRSLTYRLYYHALTRQYRLSTGGGLHQSFESLSEAMRMLSRLRNWAIAEAGEKTLKPGENYQAGLRLRLDIAQLPRPFQITALGNKDWNFDSGWKTWAASLPPLPAAGAAAEAK